MKIQQLLDTLEGIKTVKMIQDQLEIDKSKAIYLVYRLRKLGYVKTRYSSQKMRVYYIDRINRLMGVSYIDIINKYVPHGVKLATSEINLIYGRVPSVEETLIYAIKQKNIRFIIASLGLFRQVRNWSLLYKFAKKNDLVREVVALYEVARLVIPKVRRMPKRYITQARKITKGKFHSLIDYISSDDFHDIEKKWRVYIPLNWEDLAEYKNR